MQWVSKEDYDKLVQSKLALAKITAIEIEKLRDLISNLPK